jgi:imidazolonepropionase
MVNDNANQLSDLNVIYADSLAQILDYGSSRAGKYQDELDIIEDGAIAIRKGQIVCVGTTKKVLREVGECPNTINARGCSVLPGLVEAHSHPIFAGNRHWEYVSRLRGKSGESVRKQGGGIWSTIVNTRSADDTELEANALRAFSAILAGGVTTLEVKSGYGLTVTQELRLLKLLKSASRQIPMDIVFTFLGAHIAPQDGSTPGQFAAMVRDEMLPQIVQQGIAEFHDITCEVGDFSASEAADLLSASRKIKMPTRVHADASSHSCGWRTAVEGGALAADHLTYTPDTEILDIGSTQTIAVLLPLAEQFYLDKVKANGRLFINTGIPVAIATDYCSSFQATSLPLTIAMACSWFGLTPAEAIVGATLNASYVIGRGKDRGSLNIGKRGDLTILRCSHPNEIATRIGAPLVRQVVSCGKVVYP